MRHDPIKRLKVVEEHVNSGKRVLTTFRLSPDKILALKLLARELECSQTDVIEQLILESAKKHHIVQRGGLNHEKLTKLYKDANNK
jgi:hypothetical protein